MRVDESNHSESEFDGRRLPAGTRLVRRLYAVRCVGVAVGGVAVAPSLAPHSSRITLMMLVGYCLVWPHVAYLLARRSHAPLSRERLNMVVDAAFVGWLLPAMQFAWLPSLIAALFIVTNSLAMAGLRAALAGLVAVAAGAVLGSITEGVHFTSAVPDVRTLACVPLLVAYPMLLGYTAFSTGSKLARKSRYLTRLIERDVLTGLLNRGAFMTRLEALIEASPEDEWVGVLFLDLDRFKEINDSLGHGAGDHLLKDIATRLTETLPPDALLSRYGGDEFVIALATGSVEQLATSTRHVLASLGRPIDLPESEVYVTASVGISVFPIDGDHVQTLIDRADIAMYRAKCSGMNGFRFFERGMAEQARTRQSIAYRLRKTSTTYHRLEYQPQVDMRTGMLVGAEALLRWRDPELGELSPAVFIPVAEEIGLICEIGNWALRAGCEQSQAWRSRWNFRLPLSINVSPLQLQRPGLAAFMADLLEETGADPALLELEVTESAVLDPDGVAIAEIHALRALGLRVAVDDFGTGYSSLSHLNNLEVDRIKIDRSFVSRVNGPVDHDPVIDAIVAIAGAMKIEVIAEGVEREAQRDFLLSRGCTSAQGFLYGASVSAGELLRDYLANGGRYPPDEVLADWLPELHV